MEDLPPFSQSLTAQLAQIQRNSIEDHIAQLARDVNAVSVTLARQDERGSAYEARIDKMEKTLSDINTKVTEVKDTTNRYKGGIAVILGAAAFLTGILVFWKELVAKFSH